MKTKFAALILSFCLLMTLNSAHASDVGDFFSTSAGMDASMLVASQSSKSNKSNKQKKHKKGKKGKKEKKSNKSNKSEKSAKSKKSDKSVKSAKKKKSKKSNKSKKSKKSDKNPPVRLTDVCLLDTGTGVYNLTAIPVSDLEGYMLQNLIGPLLVRYRDADDDTLGDPNVSIETCGDVIGYVANANDLDDTFPDFSVD